MPKVSQSCSSPLSKEPHQPSEGCWLKREVEQFRNYKCIKLPCHVELDPDLSVLCPQVSSTMDETLDRY